MNDSAKEILENLLRTPVAFEMFACLENGMEVSY